MVCRSKASNYEAAIVTLDFNSFFGWRDLLRFNRTLYF